METWGAAAAAMDVALGVQGGAAPPVLWRASGRPPLVADPELQQAAATLQAICSVLRCAYRGLFVVKSDTCLMGSVLVRKCAFSKSSALCKG